ncbi:hypothetical protein C8J57DRAFT_1254624 [Mycena rebaudengoi]|nr:hypothetical protein C8J57DRAFT_1254624 [Mycena rebaudengoi]
MDTHNAEELEQPQALATSNDIAISRDLETIAYSGPACTSKPWLEEETDWGLVLRRLIFLLPPLCWAGEAQKQNRGVGTDMSSANSIPIYFGGASCLGPLNVGDTTSRFPRYGTYVLSRSPLEIFRQMRVPQTFLVPPHRHRNADINLFDRCIV